MVMETTGLLKETFLSIDLSKYTINKNLELLRQCEICYKAQDCELVDIFNANFNGKSLFQILDNFPSIKDCRFIESSSEYAFSLCLICVEQLVSSYLFLEKVKKSNENFKGFLKLDSKVTEQQNFAEVDLTASVINTKDILNDFNAQDNLITPIQFLSEENLKNNFIDEQEVLVEHVDVTHDHSYIQNTDLHDADKTKNDNEIENIQLVIEEKPDTRVKFLCDICSEGFSRKQSLDYHIRRIHLNEKTFLCSTCGKQFFLQVDYNRHILQHKSELLHKCNICKKGFVTFGLLKNHKKNVHKAKEIKCIECSKMFKLQTQLNKHILKVHDKQEKGIVKEKVECKACGKKVYKYALKTHMERHSGSEKYQCEICRRKFFQSLSLNNHMKRHQAPEFSCEYCGKSLFTKQEMLTHIRRQHTREIVCTCQHCGKGFVHQSNLIQHIRNCHPGDNEEKFVEPKIPKQCTVCGKIYSSRTSLIHHRKRAHENKEHPCTECAMTFRNLVPLKNHLKKIHNIGDTQICDICDKSFYTRDELSKHRKRTHHVGINAWYLRCTVCNIEKFKTKHELIQHVEGQHLISDDTDGPQVLYECNNCVTFFVNFEIYQKHLVQEHPNKTRDEVVILEYEIGGCKVQYFQNKRNNTEHR